MSGTSTARSKQTQATLDTITESLRMGIPFSRSCKAAGISAQSGHAWRQAGWQEIEEADANSNEAISFVGRFAIAVEGALVEFMGPLVARLRDESTGKGKGDWRAAKELLASRFPNEFSEKTHAAKSARLEIAGDIAHSFHDRLKLTRLSP